MVFILTRSRQPQGKRPSISTNELQSIKAMHLIAICNLRQDIARHPDAQQPIKDWYNIVRKADWKNLEAVRKIYRDAEAVGNFTVFNVKGNRYRLIVDIDYENGVIYYKYFLIHAEYDKDRWKNDPHF